MLSNPSKKKLYHHKEWKQKYPPIALKFQSTLSDKMINANTVKKEFCREISGQPFQYQNIELITVITRGGNFAMY